MKIYFLILEILSIILIFYVVIKKGQLSVVYFPVFIFSGEIINSALPASVGYLITLVLLIYYFMYNLPFITKNVFSVFITLYFLILLINVNDFEKVRPSIVGASVLFLLIGILPEIYKKYRKEVVSKELSNSCLYFKLIIFYLF